MAGQPISQGIKQLLTTHVGTSGWTIEIGQMPPTPDRVHMISDTGGAPANPKWLLDYPTAQVMVRGAVGSYLATFLEAKAVKDLLLGLPSQVINDDRWVSVLLMSDVYSLGVDENNRPLFSINFRFIVEPVASAETNRIAL